MIVSLIRFYGKHISAAQLTMTNDRVMKGFIHNMGKLAIPKIHGYLQATRFLHASRMSGGCKLDLQLISVLVERWRLETHTFHFLCGKCTTTLEDVVLQLGFNSGWASHYEICDYSGQRDPLTITVRDGPRQV
ncbi:hypothetical protein J1N35_037400 [Gossypium stocksii]|uniref:Aminotransferase-like plant mobile domain-containing protein n=1 Tax=Gossypium stocksii TaxID=47602 RepID=A0A9D3UK39_9ROSI|nr:hypothetical protein J1N35_037400 [Gossypium stocksii]